MMKTDKSVIIIGTNTAALRAQRVVRGGGVQSKTVRRTDPYGRGCVYGIEVEKYELNRAVYLLGINGINYGFI